MFSNVYIYGLGMMGGSLAKSIKQKNLAKKIYGFDINHENLIFAKKKKIIDDYDNNFKYLENADLIIICAPVSKYKSIFKNISKNKKEGAIITDIGSTKVDIIREYKKAFNKNIGCFVGSHPLTGKESSSVHNSDANLFHKAVILVTPEGIEVGHIFYFGDKYSKPMGASVDLPGGKKLERLYIPLRWQQEKLFRIELYLNN